MTLIKHLAAIRQTVHTDEEMAEHLGITVEELLQYENETTDISLKLASYYALRIGCELNVLIKNPCNLYNYTK